MQNLPLQSATPLLNLAFPLPGNGHRCEMAAYDGAFGSLHFSRPRMRSHGDCITRDTHPAFVVFASDEDGRTGLRTGLPAFQPSPLEF